MKLPSLKRLQKTDSPEEMMVVLNNFMQVVYATLNRGINFQDNFETQEFVAKIDGSSPAISFPCTLTRPARMVLIAQIAGAPITGGVSPTWQQVGNNIEISDITGLSLSDQYRIRFLVL